VPAGGTPGMRGMGVAGVAGARTSIPGAGAAGNAGDVRPGLVFVAGPNGPEPRMVLLGLNDWDYTEIVRGLDVGEPVILMSVARLQAQQQEMLNRFRERNSGPIPGAGGRR